MSPEAAFRRRLWGIGIRDRAVQAMLWRKLRVRQAAASRKGK